MSRFRSLVSLLACSAGLGVLACAGQRPASGVGDPRPSHDGFPHEAWEAADSIEGLGWSSARLAALKASVDSVGSTAFMIVTRGKVVAAWGDTARTFWTHSVRKSFMSALVGMAVA